MTSQPDMTAKVLSDRIFEQFGRRISEPRINAVRRECGWTINGTRYCQLIRLVNREKRVEWCTRMLETEETFDNVIFTDESKIEMGQVSKRSYRKRGFAVPRHAKPKHPYSLLVWGGISKRGTTPLVIFKGNMNSIFFQQHILEAAFIPFVNAAYQDSHRLYQDNDSKHTSRSTQAFMEEHNINWWRSPAESPDLNPIELVWDEMKHYINTQVRPRKKEDFEAGLHEFWGTLTAERCTSYINHLVKVIPKVIEVNGEASSY